MAIRQAKLESRKYSLSVQAVNERSQASNKSVSSEEIFTFGEIAQEWSTKNFIRLNKYILPELKDTPIMKSLQVQS